MFFKKFRPKGKWLLISSLVLFGVSLSAFASEENKLAQESGFASSTDKRKANEAGFSDPKEWEKHRADIEREDAARAAASRAEADAKKAAEAERLAALEAKRIPPADEQALIDAVVLGRDAYRSASNDMAKGATRPRRASSICSVFKSASVSNWVGTIKQLSSNNEGKGVLVIEIAEDLAVGTWNNAVSDISDNTLIGLNSQVFQTAMYLREGEWVTFSGRFIPDRTDCFREQSLTLPGSMRDPLFVFRFSGIEPLN